MAITTKSLAEASANWTQVTPTRSGVYSTNAQAAVSRLVANTIAAIPNYQAAVTGQGVASRIRTNIAGRGARRYPEKIRTVGQQRFASGVQAAQSEYESGFGPFLRVIQGVELPGKGPRGDPRNYALVQAVGEALHRARMTATASGG